MTFQPPSNLIHPIPMDTSNISNDLDVWAYHIANSKAYKFYVETGKHLRDNIKVDYQRQAKQALTAYIQQECDRARVDELHRTINYFTDEGRESNIVLKAFVKNRLAQLKDLNQGGEDDQI